MAENFTAEEIAELRDKFKLLDLNGDGKISIEEFTAVLGEGMCKTQIWLKFNSVDTDGNGTIDFEEFLGAHLENSGNDNRFEELFT